MIYTALYLTSLMIDIITVSSEPDSEWRMVWYGLSFLYVCAWGTNFLWLGKLRAFASARLCPAISMEENTMTETEKALAGLDYDSRDTGVAEYQARVKRMVHEFNRLPPDDPGRSSILSELVGGYNQYVFIESGFQCVFGRNIHFKGMAMLNFNCTLLDSNIITIGDCTLIGPGCSLICTNHAVDAADRLKGVFHNRPITIGDRVWLGANVTVLPGVTIGDEAVIGAGSVVTHDIPPGVVAAGNPCRVLRSIEAGNAS